MRAQVCKGAFNVMEAIKLFGGIIVYTYLLLNLIFFYRTRLFLISINADLEQLDCVNKKVLSIYLNILDTSAELCCIEFGFECE